MTLIQKIISIIYQLSLSQHDPRRKLTSFLWSTFCFFHVSSRHRPWVKPLLYFCARPIFFQKNRLFYKTDTQKRKRQNDTRHKNTD